MLKEGELKISAENTYNSLFGPGSRDAAVAWDGLEEGDDKDEENGGEGSLVVQELHRVHVKLLLLLTNPLEVEK